MTDMRGGAPGWLGSTTEPEALLAQAMIAFNQADTTRAIAIARQILGRDVAHRRALALLGQCLTREGRVAQGLAISHAAGATTEAADNRQTTAPDARVVDLLRDGNAAVDVDDLDAAEAAYRAALDLDPRFAAALGNLGNILIERGDLTAGFDSYRAALAIEPDNADIGFAYGLGLLLAGDFAEGWRWHECRQRTGGLRWNFERRPELPHWRDGMDLTGRRVLVMAEQGRGDVIQHARLLPMLARRAARVEWDVPSGLARLFPEMPGVTRILDRDLPVPDCDIAVPILSLPRVLDLTLDTIPPPVVTVRDDLRAQWAAWLGARQGGRRIGLCVSGEERHPHDARRSIKLELFAAILDLQHQFTLVQTELRTTDRDVLESMDWVRFPGAALTDFADTAGLLANLDLLITVDTSVAHLAGSVGIPVWLLLPHAPDHRWMLGRNDSPWYPTMRLFRQTVRGRWDDVLDRVRAELERSESPEVRESVA
jgi:tetratricopeptide (TPR) repeat protein